MIGTIAIRAAVADGTAQQLTNVATIASNTLDPNRANNAVTLTTATTLDTDMVPPTTGRRAMV